MLMLWMLARVRIITRAEPQSLRRFHLVVILAPALAVGWAVARDLYDVIRNKPYEPWVVAQQLYAMGIAPGTDVGYIGSGGDPACAAPRRRRGSVADPQPPHPHVV